ncbi:MAG TPA: peptidylprolyl isomerase [Byssovorax sp.]|jgi:parvulin-like peptidyl-prolyl isomerase
MQRWTAIAFGLLVAGAIAVAVAAATPSTPSTPAPSASASGSASAPPSDAAPPADAGAASAPRDAGAAAPSDPGSPIDAPFAGGGATDAGGTLLSGDAPPALATDAPKSVSFGVILVQYRGAQAAPPNARTRDDALKLAKQIAEDAKADFKAAVAKGDPGSSENMGKISRGFLEPAPEFVLFSLAKDGVSDPVDTPRGFWIVKRNE